MSPTVVLVTGSRDWRDHLIIREELQRLQEEHEKSTPSEPHTWTLVHGGCKGADMLADTVAKQLEWNVVSIPVLPQEWTAVGKKAGILRNTEMIKKHRPHYAIAFQLDDSPGTAHCIAELNKYRGQIDTRLKKPVRVVKRTTQQQNIATSGCHRRMRKDLADYKRERISSPWLPEIEYSDPEKLDQLEGTFDIPGHPPFQFIVGVTTDFPFKPLKLQCIPMPDELYECALGNYLHMWTYEHSPGLKLLHLVLTIYGAITLHDLPTDSQWKGKGKTKSLKRSHSPEVEEEVAKQRRRKLPELEKRIAKVETQLEDQFQLRVSKAIAQSLGM